MHSDAATTAMEQLLAGSPQGGASVERRFWVAYWPIVLPVCVRILGKGLPAEEVAAEVLWDFMAKYVHTLNAPAAAKSYVQLMAARRAVREHTRLKKPKAFDMDAVPDPRPGIDATMISPALLDRLNICLEKLGAKARQALKLRFFAELTNEEIGDLVGGSKQYIGRLQGKSLVFLRRCLQRAVSVARHSFAAGDPV